MKHGRIIVLSVCLCSVTSLASEFRAGAAQVRITPPIGVPMSGYYYERAATGVHDDLYAHALVFAKQDAKIALVTCDLIGMDAHLVSQARQCIEKATGIPGHHVMISCTHAHTGPTLARDAIRNTQTQTEADLLLSKYIKTLPDLLAQAVKQARDNLVPAHVSAGVGHEDSISFNRRFFMTDDTVGWNPGKLNPKIIKPAGPIDPAVAVVYVESSKGVPISTYVNFANHLDTVGGLEFSADYPYALYTLLSRVRSSDMVTLFAQGCSGNINHINVASAERQKGHAEAERIGTVLAGEVLKTYTRLKPIDPACLAVRWESVKLPLPDVTPDDVVKARNIAATYNTPNAAPFMSLVNAFKVISVHELNGMPLEAEIQVMALGQDLAWVGLPGEVFVEIGMAIKQASPYHTTIVTELANGSIGYIPDSKALCSRQL